MLNKKSSINVLKTKLRLKSKTDSSLTKVAWSPYAMNPDNTGSNPISHVSGGSPAPRPKPEPERSILSGRSAERTQSNYTVKKHPDGFLYLIDQNGNVLTYEGSGFNFNDPQYKDQFQMAGYFNNMYGQPFVQDSVVEDLDNYNRETRTHSTIKVNAIPTGHMPVIIPHDVIQNAGLAEGKLNPQALHDLLYYNGPARLRALDMSDNMPKVDTTSHMYTAFHPDDDSIVGTYRAYVDMMPLQRRVLNLIVQDAQLPDWTDNDSELVRQQCVNSGITDPDEILRIIEGEKYARNARREAARTDLRSMDSYVPTPDGRRYIDRNGEQFASTLQWVGSDDEINNLRRYSSDGDSTYGVSSNRDTHVRRLEEAFRDTEAVTAAYDLIRDLDNRGIPWYQDLSNVDQSDIRAQHEATYGDGLNQENVELVRNCILKNRMLIANREGQDGQPDHEAYKRYPVLVSDANLEHSKFFVNGKDFITNLAVQLGARNAYNRNNYTERYDPNTGTWYYQSNYDPYADANANESIPLVSDGVNEWSGINDTVLSRRAVTRPSIDERRLAIVDRHLRENSNFSSFLQQVIGQAHNGSLNNSEFISTPRLAPEPFVNRDNYLSTRDFLAHTHLLGDDRDLYRLRYAPDGDTAWNSTWWEHAVKNNADSIWTNPTGLASQWVIAGLGHNLNSWFGDGSGQNFIIDFGNGAKTQLSPAGIGQAFTGMTNMAISDYQEDARQQGYAPTFDSILKNQYGYEDVNNDLSKVNPWVLRMATYQAGIKAPSRFKYYATEGYNGMNAIGIADGTAMLLEGVSYLPVATAAAQGFKTAGRIAIPAISRTVNRALASSAGKIGLHSVARNAANRLATSQAASVAGHRLPLLIDDLYRVSHGGAPSRNLTMLNIDPDTLINGLVRYDKNSRQLLRGADALADESQLHKVVLDSPTYDLFNLERVGLNSPNAGKWSALQIAGLPAGLTKPYWSAAARAARMYGDDMMLNRMRNTGTILRDAWHAPSTLSGFKSMTGSFMPDLLANAVMPNRFINDHAPMIGRNINRLHNFNKLRRSESAMTMVGSPFWNNITEQSMLHSLSPTIGKSVDPYTGDILPSEQTEVLAGAGGSITGLESLIDQGRGILSGLGGYNQHTGKYDYIPDSWLSGPSDYYYLGLGPWLADKYSIMQSQGNIGDYFTEESAPDRLLVRDYSINGGDSYRRINLTDEGYHTDAIFDRQGHAYFGVPDEDNDIILGGYHSYYSPSVYANNNYVPYDSRIFYNTDYGNVIPYDNNSTGGYQLNVDNMGGDTSSIGGYNYDVSTNTIRPGRTFNIDSGVDHSSLGAPQYNPGGNQPNIDIFTGQEIQPGQPIYIPNAESTGQGYITIENTGSDSITIGPGSTINTPLPSALPASRVGGQTTPATTSPSTLPASRVGGQTTPTTSPAGSTRPATTPKRRYSGGGFNVDNRGGDTSTLNN